MEDRKWLSIALLALGAWITAAPLPARESEDDLAAAEAADEPSGLDATADSDEGTFPSDRPAVEQREPPAAKQPSSRRVKPSPPSGLSHETSSARTPSESGKTKTLTPSSNQRWRPARLKSMRPSAPAALPKTEEPAEDTNAETSDASEGDELSLQPADETPPAKPKKNEALTPTPAKSRQKQGTVTPAKPPAQRIPEEEKPLEPMAATKPVRSGGALMLTQAYEKTKHARDEADYTDVIDLCRSATDSQLSDKNFAYAGRLSAWAYNRRGEARGEQGRDEEALADFQTALELDAGQWRSYHNRGVCQAKLGKYQEAIDDFNRTIKMKPDFANAYFNRAELRYDRNDFDGAVQDYDQAIRLSPNDSAAYNSRGHAHYRLDQFRQAIADYNASVKLQPDNAAAYTNRGDAYADLGYYANAARDYRAAIKINPELGRAYQSAAWLMATCPDSKFRNEKLALEAAQKALELDGDEDYLYLETLAAAQANAGQYDEAAETQAKVVQLAPSGEMVRYEHCLALYKKGQPYREKPRRIATSTASAPAARYAQPPRRR